MNDNIKIIVAQAHKNQLDNPTVSNEINEVQNYFNTESFKFKDNTINFVFLSGEYSQIKRTMLVMGVFVNKMDTPILAFNTKLRLQFKTVPAQIATAKLSFPEEFIGELGVNEGLIFHLEIPVKGLEQDRIFNFSDIEGKMDDVEVLKKES